MYSRIEKRATSASEDNFQSAQSPNPCETFNWLSIQSISCNSGYRKTSLHLNWDRIHSKNMNNISHKKMNSLDLGLQISGLSVGQAHWHCIYSTHGKPSTARRITGGQERPYAQPSLLKQTEEPYPTLYYTQWSQWYHSWQWYTHSKWRLRRAEMCKFIHTY